MLNLAADGIWTHDLILTKDALYQLSYSSDYTYNQKPLCNTAKNFISESVVRSKPLCGSPNAKKGRESLPARKQSP